MKQIRKNTIKIMVLLISLFAVVAVYLLYDMAVYSNRWINSANNPRLDVLRRTNITGGIFDRNGVTLAGVSAGKRTYPDDRDLRLAIAHVIGDQYGFSSTGVETLKASTLLGNNESIVEFIKRAISQNYTHGSDITLTIDSNLNKKAMDLLSGYAGAIVLINYHTGEILSMASAPSFDPEKIDPSKANGGTSGDELVNRAIQGQYAPGSIFKIITFAAASGAMDLEQWSFDCPGFFTTGGRPVTCPAEHGEQDIQKAFAESCNSAFAQLGLDSGYRSMVSTAKKAGFNKNFVFDDIILYSSHMSLNACSESDEIAFAAIGQHQDIVSPLHMAMLAGAIANGGSVMTPRLLLAVEDQPRAIIPKVAYEAYNAQTAARLDVLMSAAVEEGTGVKAQIPGYRVCGKTGTAEVSESGDLAPHSWFIGYISGQSPLAIAVIMENAGAGGDKAAAAAGKMLKYALDLGY